jgi:phage terminase large subunit-like protein
VDQEARLNMAITIPVWDTSCPDWEERLLAGRSIIPALPLFKDEAARALRTFKRLHIPDMIGQPTIGEVGGPWLFPIVETIFGSFDPVLGRRVVQEFFLLIAKKNSKTTSGASIMITALLMNTRPEAEFVLVAPTKEIADIALNYAAGIINTDESLQKLFHVQKHIRRITHRENDARLVVKASDTDVITGGKQVGTLIDELHVLSDKSNAADVIVEIRGALAARPDGFLIFVTTQSKRPPSGVFKSELAKARDIRDGKLQYPMLPILYELPQRLSINDGWKKRETWQLVNPNLGRSVDESYLERELRAAERTGKEQLALFASQHFNVEIGVGLLQDRWAGVDYWDEHGDPSLTLETLLERSDVVTVGVDGGGLFDLLGLVILGRDRTTKQWLVWCHAFAHKDLFDKNKQDVPRFLDFVASKDLTVVNTMTEAFEAVADYCEKVDLVGLLAEVGLDPWGVAPIVEELKHRGIEGDKRVVGVSQGWKLTGTIKMTEGKLSDGKVAHGGSAMMSWCVSNCRVEPRGNAVIITKAMSGSGKIDPVMAMFNAMSLMSQNPMPTGMRSIYESEDHPLLVLQ